MSNCAKDFCKKFYMPKTVNSLRYLEAKARKSLRKVNKTSKVKFPTGLTPKTLKRIETQCIKTYCNPGCKNTMFSTRKNTAAMKRANVALARKTHKNPEMQKILVKFAEHTRKSMRKILWHKGESPLADSFYMHLDPKDVKAMKEKGAESGCTIMLPNDMFKLIGRTMNNLKD